MLENTKKGQEKYLKKYWETETRKESSLKRKRNNAGDDWFIKQCNFQIRKLSFPASDGSTAFVWSQNSWAEKKWNGKICKWSLREILSELCI